MLNMLKGLLDGKLDEVIKAVVDVPAAPINEQAVAKAPEPKIAPKGDPKILELQQKLIARGGDDVIGTAKRTNEVVTDASRDRVGSIVGRDLVVAVHRLVPVPVGARPHGVDTRQAADITRYDPAGREQERRQRDHIAELGLPRIFGDAPQRIVVADAVRVVADVVACGLVAPRLGGLADLDADARAKRIEAFVGDLGKAAFHLRHLPVPCCEASCG